MPNINAFERKIYSQNGEDGILEAIFQSIGTTDQFIVEFGVENGRECNSAHLIKDCGWAGLLIEGNADLYRELLKTFAESPRVRLVNRFITAENIADIFREVDVPEDFDLLSIDVDGNDYWIWLALSRYRPRVIVIEFNSAHPPPERWVMEYNPAHTWDGTSYFGASLASLTALGKERGYALLGTDSRGVNAFFLRRDLLARSRFPVRSVRRAFHPPSFLNAQGQVGHPPGSGPFQRI